MKKYLLAVILLTGCASTPGALMEALIPARALGDNVTCTAPCKTEWERAQFWVAKHSKMKIQNATDVLVQTYNGSGSTYGFTVTKEPLSSSQYRIKMEALCASSGFGCSPKPPDVVAAFLYYVSTGNDVIDGRIDMTNVTTGIQLN